MEIQTEPEELELLTEEQIALLPTAETLEELEPATEQDIPAAESQPRSKTPLLLRLTRRAVIFLFLLLVTFLCFYIAGCIQGFLDQDLTLLLFAVTSVSILLVLFSSTAVLECLIFLIAQRRIRFLFYIVPFLLVTAIAIVAAAVSNSINLLSRGI